MLKHVHCNIFKSRFETTHNISHLNEHVMTKDIPDLKTFDVFIVFEKQIAFKIKCSTAIRPNRFTECQACTKNYV